MKQFFSHNPEDGWDLHDTLEEARTSAEGWFRADENNAGSDGWHPDVEDTCYGRIVPVGQVVETGRRPVDPDVDGEYMADHFKEVIQYEMREVQGEVMTPTVDGFKVLSLELSVHPSIPYINVTLGRRKQRDGEDVWAICEMGHCFNHQGEWEYEPIPSERTPEFFERCRWPSMEAAIAFWRANGKSRLV